MVCPVCEGTLDKSCFRSGDNVCRICRVRLKQDEDVDFSPSERKTIRQAYTNLMLAIRRQAELDGELEEWEVYWLKNGPWPRIWEMLKDTVDKNESIRSELRRHIGGQQ